MSSNIIINSTPDSIFHLIHFWRQCYTIITTNIRYRMNNCGGGLVSSSTRSEGGKNVTKKYLNSITLKNQLEIWVDIEGESKFYSNCISNLSAFRVSNLPSRIWSSFIFNCLIEFCPPIYWRCCETYSMWLINFVIHGAAVSNSQQKDR